MFVLLLLLLLLGWLCESCWICLDILRREWERLWMVLWWKKWDKMESEVFWRDYFVFWEILLEISLLNAFYCFFWLTCKNVYLKICTLSFCRSCLFLVVWTIFTKECDIRYLSLLLTKKCSLFAKFKYFEIRPWLSLWDFYEVFDYTMLWLSSRIDFIFWALLEYLLSRLAAGFLFMVFCG